MTKNPSVAICENSGTNSRTRTRGDEDLSRRLSNQANMLAFVAHDLRQPLFRIAMAAELAGSNGDVSALTRTLEAVQSSLVCIHRLVDDLDDFGSLQAGQLRLICRSLEPAAVVSAALAAFEPIAAAKHVRLSATIEDGVGEIFADPERMQQVISNLIVNALFLTPSGGCIAITVKSDGDRIQFAVSDSGPGIGASDLPHLFDRYWRGTQGWYAGRGLGLAIARDLVASHGGEIWASNEPVCGARISFTVPVTV